ncbi:MAG: DEAD/DEAH box helicase family protein [Aureliella sp.]
MPGSASTLSKLWFDQGTLVLSGWSALGIERVFGERVWTWDARIGGWRAPAILYSQVAEALERHAAGTHDEAVRWQTVNWANVQLPPPRPEQAAAVKAWWAKHRGLVVMPTGTGKTEVALQIMAQARCSALIVAPIRDLMYQWHQRILRALDYDAGIIGDNTFNLRAVSVTTYDSACIHMPQLGNRFKLLIFDECHHLPGMVRSDAARMSLAPWRLGLSATPERSDGRHSLLDELIGPEVYRLAIDAVRGRSLADYTVFRIPVHLSVDEQARYDALGTEVREYFYAAKQDDPTFTWEKLCAQSASDLASRRALAAYRAKQAIEDRAEEKLRILEDLFRLHQGTPMIVFAGSNAMARDVSRRFLLPCLLSHCGKRERLDYLEGLRDGVYPAIVANQVLDEGVDIPAVKVAVVIGGMASTKQAQQRLGRILRRTGNHSAVLYEVVCQDTNEALRSRKRRASDAYTGTRHRRL